MRISDWSSDVCSSDLEGPPCRPWAQGTHGEVGPQRSLPVRLAEAVSKAAASPRAGFDGVNRHDYHRRSEEHTSELQPLMRTSYAVFCLKKKEESQYQLSITITIIRDYNLPNRTFKRK